MTSSDESAGSTPARILVADDRPEMACVTDRSLGEVYTCEFASNVEEARQKLRTETFDLALCDIRMTGQPRFALAQEIVKGHPETAAVLVTEEARPEVARRAFALGVSDYLVEPLQPGQLLITVTSALRRRNLEIAAREAANQVLSATRERAMAELRQYRQEMVGRLAKAIELHDSSTGVHVIRMAGIASFLGSHLGLSDERVGLLRDAALMHDVGKIGISEEILRKPGSLTAEESREMQHHPVIGHEILTNSKSELLRMAATIALTHHEWFDGTGYPKELAGKEIPLEGRITAVADVFDALLSDRCYRPAVPAIEATAFMKDGRGTQFDPLIVDALLENIDEVLALRG